MKCGLRAAAPGDHMLRWRPEGTSSQVSVGRGRVAGAHRNEDEAVQCTVAGSCRAVRSFSCFSTFRIGAV